MTIPEGIIDDAAGILTKHLSTYADGKGIELVGGANWWQLRGRELEGEWLEVCFSPSRLTPDAQGV